MSPARKLPQRCCTFLTDLQVSDVRRSLLVTGFGYEHDDAWAANMELFKELTDVCQVGVLTSKRMSGRACGLPAKQGLLAAQSTQVCIACWSLQFLPLYHVGDA